MLARQLAFWSLVFLVGCKQSVVTSPLDLGAVEGSYSFGAGSSAEPGLGKGSIYFGGKRVVLWVNGRTATGEARTAATGISCTGEITRDSGEPISFSYTIPSENSGSVLIADKTFKLSYGNLFLVDCISDELRVRQLERSFDDVRFAVGADTGQAVRKSLSDDNDVLDFFKPAPRHSVAGR